MRFLVSWYILSVVTSAVLSSCPEVTDDSSYSEAMKAWKCQYAAWQETYQEWKKNIACAPCKSPTESDAKPTTTPLGTPTTPLSTTMAPTTSSSPTTIAPTTSSSSTTTVEETTTKLGGGLEEEGWQKFTNGSAELFYKLFVDPATYYVARNNCMHEGGRLAARGMRNAEIKNALIADIINPYGGNVWIGLDDLEKIKTYVWADGVISTPANTLWAVGEPSPGQYRCVQVWTTSQFRLDNTGCDNLRAYVCEIET